MNLDAGSRGGRVGALFGAAVVFAVLWGVIEAVTWLVKLVKRRSPFSVRVTSESSLAFPAFTEVTVPAPGTDVPVAQGELEVQGPAVDALGRFVVNVFKGLFALATLIVHFWLTGWLARRAGFGYEITGFWPTLGGTAIFNVLYWAMGTIVIRDRPEPEAGPGSVATTSGK